MDPVNSICCSTQQVECNGVCCPVGQFCSDSGQCQTPEETCVECVESIECGDTIVDKCVDGCCKQIPE
jgi:hypothetical protein